MTGITDTHTINHNNVEHSAKLSVNTIMIISIVYVISIFYFYYFYTNFQLDFLRGQQAGV